jgi:hypothetical protein
VTDPYNHVGCTSGQDGTWPAIKNKHSDRLEELLKQNFLCVDGPPRAYHEIHDNYLDAIDKGCMRNVLTFRFVYSTIRFRVPGPMTDETCDRLVSFVWETVFSPIVQKILAANAEYDKNDLMLFWRKRPRFSEIQGDTYLRMRLAIPGIEISGHVFEGLETPFIQDRAA